jgi:tRNA A-37 threonylcarbamoyl transferase component Bud32
MNDDELPLSAEPTEVSTPKEGNGMAAVSLEGQTLGRYRVLEPLGRGGMARVYRAYHPQLNRYVAIKVLRSDLMEDEDFLARFRREAQAVAALRHPNIVQVFDFDVQDELYFMVMELLEGDTLKTRLNDYRVRDEKMPAGEVVRVLLDVLDGLAYAHNEGMIHRDIKSANILLTKKGQAVIADFGIAQIVGSTRHTASGALMGTLDYMAPEQGLEGHSDARSDIYSLGIVFYEMLTQRTPFEADTPLAVLMKHVNDPLPLPRKMDPTIPEPFERIVLKALAKDPDDRYQGAEEMAQALREAAEESGIELPKRISLPLSFTTSEAPSESVAVFSGTAREKITDAGFAAYDTDAALGAKLAAELGKGAQPGEGAGGAGQELLNAMGALGRVVVGKTAKALREAVDAIGSESEEEADSEEVSVDAPSVEDADGASEPRSAARPTTREDRRAAREAKRAATAARRAAAAARRAEGKGRRGNVGLAVLGAIGLLIFANLCMLTVAFPTGFWEIYHLGWPIQIFLVGWGLCIIMYVASSIWMLIPAGLVLAAGGLLAYSQLTDNWNHWNFSWLFLVWVAIISVFTPVFMSKSKSLARGLSRLLAILLSLASILSIIFVGVGVGIGGIIVPFVIRWF